MILVMGGAGYIGSHTTQHLLDNNYDCVVADSLIYGHKESVSLNVPFIKADLLDKESLRAVFKRYEIDAVIHFAAFTYVGESIENPQKYYENNLMGTLNLLNVMLEYNVKKIIFSSTAAIYGEPQYTPIDENHPQNPINPYGRTKLMIEQLFKDYEKAYGLQHISVRYFNASGASSNGEIGESHTPESHLIPLVLKAIKGETKCIKIFGTDYDTKDGTCIRDYIHVEDLALAHRLALENINKYNGGINLGTSTGISVKEIITLAEKLTGKTCPTEIAPRRTGDPSTLYASNKLAGEILGWTPTHSNIENIIETAWKWEQNKKF